MTPIEHEELVHKTTNLIAGLEDMALIKGLRKAADDESVDPYVESLLRASAKRIENLAHVLQTCK